MNPDDFFMTVGIIIVASVVFSSVMTIINPVKVQDK